MTDDGDRLSRAQAHAIEDLLMGGNFVVRSDGAVEGRINVENARHTSNSGENAFLLGYDCRRGSLVGVNASVAGGIARGPVFEQRVLEDGGDAS